MRTVHLNPPNSQTLHRNGLGALLAVLALAVALAFPLPANAQTMRAQEPVAIADLTETLLGAVVNISTSQRISGSRRLPLPDLPEGSPFEDFFDEFFDPDGGNGPSRENSLGSGFLIDAEGTLVTNYHVIEGADDIEVLLTDGRSFPASIVGLDEVTDLAVLKIEAGEPLPFVRFADSDAVRIGDWVLAIGNPFGLGGSVSLGIVSAMNRNIGAGPYDAFIQTDAAINRGNSGGPLFDLNGEVVGVNTAILSPTGRSVGVGFAIPSATVQPIIDQLIRFGETRRGMLGVNIQEVTSDMVEALALDRPRGALVSVVSEGGPAEEAGIERGDVIVSFNGRPISTYTDLPARVAQVSPGSRVPVEIIRRGETLALTVVVGMRDGDDGEPLDAPMAEPVSLLGMELSTVEDAIELGFDLDGTLSGAVVTVVFSDSPASAKGIEPGTVILEVGQEMVATPDDVRSRVEALRDEGRSQILMLVRNPDGESEFVALAAD